MAKGYDQHKQRQQELASFGRELVRRSKAKCELCGVTGVSLLIFEVPPVPAEPDFAHCIHLCETCQHQIETPKLRAANHWRCLYEAIWSEVPAVQVMAVRLLRRLAAQERWAGELLNDAYLTEETLAWAAEAE
jgi:protein PhnA